MNNGLIAVILMDCMAIMPSFGWSRARAFITKVEKAKKTPATNPQPSAVKSVKGKRKLSTNIIKPPVNYCPTPYSQMVFGLRVIGVDDWSLQDAINRVCYIWVLG
ncbi:hypothetical protein [Nostoc sp.]|uniref:hypothetical protein n=1 Tax=Nostoc sp. TaxID=1180 RepID=UPI002FEF94D4